MTEPASPADRASLLRDQQRRRWIEGDPVALETLLARSRS